MWKHNAKNYALTLTFIKFSGILFKKQKLKSFILMNKKPLKSIICYQLIKTECIN